VPLCVEYCTKTEDLRKILGEFLEKIGRRQNEKGIGMVPLPRMETLPEDL